jgi:hypothetical protein
MRIEWHKGPFSLPYFKQVSVWNTFEDIQRVLKGLMLEGHPYETVIRVTIAELPFTYWVQIVRVDNLNPAFHWEFTLFANDYKMGSLDNLNALETCLKINLEMGGED